MTKLTTILFPLLALSVVRMAYIYQYPIPKNYDESHVNEFSNYSLPKKLLTIGLGIPVVVVWETIPNYSLRFIIATCRSITIFCNVVLNYSKVVITWLIEKVTIFCNVVWGYTKMIINWLIEKITIFCNVIWGYTKMIINWLIERITTFCNAVWGYTKAITNWLIERITIFCNVMWGYTKVVVAWGEQIIVQIAEVVRQMLSVGYTIGKIIVDWFIEKTIIIGNVIWGYTKMMAAYARQIAVQIAELLRQMMSVGYTIGKIVVDWFIEKLLVVWGYLSTVAMNIYQYSIKLISVLYANIRELFFVISQMIVDSYQYLGVICYEGYLYSSKIVADGYQYLSLVCYEVNQQINMAIYEAYQLVRRLS